MELRRPVDVRGPEGLWKSELFQIRPDVEGVGVLPL